MDDSGTRHLMNTYKRLAEVENGELVVASRAGANRLGIKGLYKDTHFVVLLVREIDGIPGPFTFVDLEGSWMVVSLGRDWVVDFDPIESIRFEAEIKPLLGSLRLGNSAPLVISHNESGRHTCSLGGEIGDDISALPVVASWRILLRQYDGEFKEVLRWPIAAS